MLNRKGSYRGFHWESGWLVYVDMNNDNRKGSADVVLELQAKLAEGVREITSNGESQPPGPGGAFLFVFGGERLRGGFSVTFQ